MNGLRTPVDALTLASEFSLIEGLENTAGYICDEARDGEEALSLIHQHPTTYLILSDFQMPKMNGLQLLQTLQNNPKTRGIHFIWLTGNSSYSL